MQQEKQIYYLGTASHW